ncbi:MAG: arginine--tRNA ligase [Bacteroidota bacterium]
MTDIQSSIQKTLAESLIELYGQEASGLPTSLQDTRKEFEGNYTIVTFPYTRVAKAKPEEIGQQLGQLMVDRLAHISDFNVIKGFLNLVVSDAYWIDFLKGIYADSQFGRQAPKEERVLVEFSSPNTNKPLHLGHIRNILLGWSTSQLLDAAGYDVVKVQIINDRGIAICKSMLAWKLFGQGETPASTGIKPDHFVGDYYVRFETAYQKEYKEWQASQEGQAVYQSKAREDQSQESFFKAFAKTGYFNEFSKLGAQAKDMLLKWEAGDSEVVQLWTQMNGWVYEGFESTYQRLGVDFDKLYYESQTYKLGKNMIEAGLQKEVFHKRDDGSVFADLTDVKLSEKTLMRSDGTSIYITQDLGTAQLRYDDFGAKRMVYVVADEQNHHFATLFELLKRLEEPYADGLHHLSYGMVDLPTGKMKSREGTIVDADDLMAEVVNEARMASAERETTSDLSEAEREAIVEMIGLAALKFFIIKVGPAKRMTFNPKEAVDLQGQTGPYVQNAYVRTQAVWRKAGDRQLDSINQYSALESIEREIIQQLHAFPGLINEAAENYDPSLMANYCYELAKNFHRFWHDHSILNAEKAGAADFRLAFCQAVGQVLKTGMNLLGIQMPDRM